MAVYANALKWSRVLIDVCTQHDFVDSGAILQVANHDTLTRNLKRLFQWADGARMPVVSLVESHRPSEPPNGFPMHCIDGTPGQRKLSYTYLSPWVMVETDNYLSLPPDLRKNYRQLVFRKRTREVLGNPKADRFLTQLKPDEFIIFGVGIEWAIKALALGLLARHKNVAVITDACGYWSLADAELAARQLAAKHIRLTTVGEITKPPAPAQIPSRRTRRMRSRHHPATATSGRRTAARTARR